MQAHPVAASGFEAQTDAYDRGRPEYPVDQVSAAIASLGVPTAPRVMDLAAGTGKLTKALVRALDPAADLVAVEPAAEMRRKFSEKFPSITVLEGTATSLPFPDAHFDLVCVGQAFHWFATEAALRELARVLKPGGTLMLVWYA